MKLKNIFICIVLLITGSGTALAQTLEVGTIERPPFSYEESGSWGGFSIEVWNAIAEKNGYDFSFRPYSQFSEMISGTENSEVDVSVTNISITLEREEKMDFSYPIYDSGLTMMIKSSGKNHVLLEKIKDTRIIISTVLILLFLIVFIKKKQLLKSKTLKKIPKKKRKHIGTIVLSILGLLTVAYVNYAIISFKFEKQDLSNTLYSYTDIGKQLVGVTSGSTSEKFAQENSISHISYHLIDKLYGSLQNGDIDIIIHDLPILEYYTKTQGNGKAEVIGEVFRQEKYGILMPSDSGLKEEINRALLEMRGNGEYEEIFAKYFNL